VSAFATILHSRTLARAAHSTKSPVRVGLKGKSRAIWLICPLRHIALAILSRVPFFCGGCACEWVTKKDEMALAVGGMLLWCIPYACIFISIHVYIRAHMHTHVHMYTLLLPSRLCVHLSTIHIYAQTHMHIRIHTYMLLWRQGSRTISIFTNLYLCLQTSKSIHYWTQMYAHMRCCC